MCLRPIHLCLILIFITTQTHAQDSTHRKKPWFMAVGAGLTINRAFGPMIDQVTSFDRSFGIKKELQKDGLGFEIDVNFQKQFSDMVYFKAGINFVQKQVNPEENSYPLYKDSLKTGYLTLPTLVGVLIPLNLNKTIYLTLEAGPCTNFKLIDKTHHGIDRYGFKTFPVVLGGQGGAGFLFRSPNGSGTQLMYTYRADITHSYDESLYWGAPNELIRTRGYQFRTHAFTISYIWPL